MQSHLKVLVDEFAQNPPQAGKTMRNLQESDTIDFAKHGLELLKTLPVSPGSNYILTLLLRVPSILEKLDSRFDIRIVKKITSTAANADRLDTKTAERMLELMSAFSDASRSLPVLAELLKHPNPRVRSKAVLLAGRVKGKAKLPDSNVPEKDNRVRANAIEALWGNSSPEARSILLAAVTNTDNRAAANAALGLYKLDDTRSIAIVFEMSAHPAPLFRCSAIWVMSETQDPRFLKTLAKLIADADTRVRHLAFHVLAKIRKNKVSLLNGPKLIVSAAEVECSMATQRKLRVSVCSEDGKPASRIAGIQFALEENKRVVTSYSVQEAARAIGIAMPATVDPASLQQKRIQDQWTILTYSPDATASGLAGAAQALITKIANQKAQRYLLVIDGPVSGQSSLNETEADALLLLAKSGDIQVHSLVVATADSIVNPHLQKLCQNSGGSVVRVAAVNEIAGALEGLLGALSTSYEVTYDSNSVASTSSLSIQIYSQQGCGEQTCEMQASAPNDSPISLPAPHELPAHSSPPALAAGS